MCLKNKLLLLFCSLTLILSLIGCLGDHNSTFKSIEHDTNNSMKMSYSKFNGYKFKALELKSGDILDLNIDVNTTSGNFSFSVLTADGTEVYKIDNPKTSLSQKINISKGGTYKLKIIADNHSGNYDIDWNVQNIDY